MLKARDDVVLIENGVKPENRRDDELETPDDTFYCVVHEAQKLGIPPPDLDCFATKRNSKCIECITLKENAFITEWLLPDGCKPRSWWLNWPHSKHHECMQRLHNQFKTHKIPAIVIIPSRVRRTRYWDGLVERFRIGSNPKYAHEQKFIHNWPISGYISFEKNGKPLTARSGKPSHTANSYEVLVFDPRLVVDWNYDVNLGHFDPKQTRLDNPDSN